MEWILAQMNSWHWLAVGLILLALELLGTAGYCLWLGISALLISTLLIFIPMSWQLQWIAFAAFCLITTWLWWRRQFRSDKKEDAERSLNQKQKQLIGQTARVEEDVEPGTFRLKIGDSTWTARTHQPIKAGTLVTITEIDGIILTVKPV